MEVKRVFRGVPKGQFHPVTYNPGDTVPPELVAAALSVGADQPAPEGSQPPPVRPQNVGQMGPDGKIGRTGGKGGKGKSASPPPPPPPPPPAPAPDLLSGGAGDGAPASEPGPAADGGAAEGGAGDGEATETGGAGEGDGEATQTDGAADGAAEQAPVSDDPNLGGLG